MYCLILNSVMVAGVIVIMSLSLHSPAPIVSYSSRQKLSLLTRPPSLDSIHKPSEPTLKKLPNVSLIPPDEKKIPMEAETSAPVVSISEKKPVSYSPHSTSLRKDTVNKDIGGGHYLADAIGRSIQDNEVLARYKSSDIHSQTPLSKILSTSGPSLALLDNRPYIVIKPLQHISSQRKLSSQNAIPKDTQNVIHSPNMLPKDNLPQQPVNWTKQTLDAMVVRNTVVDDTAAQFSSKHDVLPLVAFFDTRQRYQHANSTVILVQVRDGKKIRYNRIVGCGIDDVRAKAFRAKPLFVYRNWIHANIPNLTHSEAVVNCYDLPTVNGSKAFVVYRPFRAPGLLKVYSERPVLMTQGTMKPLSVVVCATVYDQPPWLAHWLRYQETLGVDHIHLYAQQSFVDKGGLEIPEVRRYLQTGRLIVDLRSTHLNNSEVCVALGK